MNNQNNYKPSYEGNAQPSFEGTTQPSKDSKVLVVDEEHCYARRPISYISRNSEIYLRNVCRLQPSLYTCAVDSFLEIFYGVFSILNEKSNVKSEFFEMIHCFLSQYRDILTSNNSYRELIRSEEIDYLELEL